LLSFWGSASRAGYIGYPSDNNLYITQVANSSILFLTNNTTQMTLNSTGLGVGVSPGSRLDVRFPTNPAVDNAGGSHALRAWTTATQAADVGGQLGLGGLYDATNSQSFATVSGKKENATSGNNAGYFSVGTCGSGGTMVERMRIDSAGRLQLGTTGGTLPSRLYLSGDATNNWSVGPYTSAATNFYITANNTAGVFLNGTGATAWSAISDERYKDIIEPISNAVSKVGSLRAVIGKFKFDPEGTRRSFLIAQDLLAAFPEVVVADNPDKLAVTYTEIIPLLVAAIKELTARVQTLETR
jgi:hypothetical protein